MLPVLRETLNQVLSKVTVLEPASCLEPILDHLRLRVGETDDRNGNHCGPIPSHYVNAGVPRRTARKCCHLEARRNDYPLPAEDWRLSWAELVLKAALSERCFGFSPIKISSMLDSLQCIHRSANFKVNILLVAESLAKVWTRNAVGADRMLHVAR